MKSKIVVLITLVLAMVLVLLSITLSSCNSQKNDLQDSSSEVSISEETDELSVETFSIATFQWEIERFPWEESVGEINDKERAIKIAKALWLLKYNDDIDINKIKVAYDAQEDCWHVYNTTPPNVLGGVDHAILRNNGEVVAVWAED